jgi:hypothetical protein
MKVSSRTLFQIAQPASPEARHRQHLELEERLSQVGELHPALAGSLKSMKPNLSRTLVGTFFADVTGTRPTGDVIERLNDAVKSLTAEKSTISFGIWDLNAMIGGLEPLLQKVNAAQNKIAFFRVVAAIPAGLISDPKRMRAWAQAHNRRPGPELEENTIFEDFLPQADKVRVEMGLDHLAGITQSMLAFEEGGEIHWNYFAVGTKRALLLSSYGLRDYASRAGRPFSTAILYLAVGQLLEIVSPSGISHEENRGCLFDFNGDRESIVESIRQCRIEPECLKLVRSDYREAASALVEVLRSEHIDNAPSR